MTDQIKCSKQLVFGLDIGTRSIVGTVGYKENEKKFQVVAQVVKMHETRAMLDGQIHDIHQVAETIKEVKQELEEITGRKLEDVCIAAAGRVLRTVTVSVKNELETETVIDLEHIHALELAAVEKAYEELKRTKENETFQFYCVGYTVVHYYLNDYVISNLEDHKAKKIGAEVLATFLPDEVIDGLYTTVEKAGLHVVNLTLEPIAAINVAIPVNYRLLNIALVDVGAGTSDISITKDGSITAYGMIPFAGDEFTEEIAKRYLVDFKTAEHIKTACFNKKTVSFKDIMGLPQKLSTEEVIKGLEGTIDKITKSVADKIIELNGQKSVSAVFIVGGGGKIPKFAEFLAKHLDLPAERVALRGEEVLQDVEFLQKDIKKDSLLVTPIGICLNFYEKNNNFIFVQVNGTQIKLYDNNKLTILDAAMQIGFPNMSLFPRRGKGMSYILNGEERFVRGEAGEAAVVRLNGKEASLSTAIEADDIIEIKESTVGEKASIKINELPEYKKTIKFHINGKEVFCPNVVKVNGTMESEFYSICEGDVVEILDYYTKELLMEFLDVDIKGSVLVDEQEIDDDEKILEGSEVDFTEKSVKEKQNTTEHNVEKETTEEVKQAEDLQNDSTTDGENNQETEKLSGDAKGSVNHESTEKNTKIEQKQLESTAQKTYNGNKTIQIQVNQTTVVLSGKENYVFVDILDFYPFDVSVAHGTEVVKKRNGSLAEFTDSIYDGDEIELYWTE